MTREDTNNNGPLFYQCRTEGKRTYLLHYASLSPRWSSGGPVLTSLLAKPTSYNSAGDNLTRCKKRLHSLRLGKGQCFFTRSTFEVLFQVELCVSLG